MSRYAGPQRHEPGVMTWLPRAWARPSPSIESCYRPLSATLWCLTSVEPRTYWSRPRASTRSERPKNAIHGSAPHPRDYLECESRNRSLGLAGEQFVAEFEARRLHSAGRKALADRIDHVSDHSIRRQGNFLCQSQRTEVLRRKARAVCVIPRARI